MSWLSGEPVLLFAVLVMIALALVPGPAARVLAVLGWVLIWLDSEITGHWLDWLGAIVLIAGLAAGLLRIPRRHQRHG